MKEDNSQGNQNTELTYLQVYRNKLGYEARIRAMASAARTYLRKAPVSDLLLMRETIDNHEDAWKKHHILKTELPDGCSKNVITYRCEALGYTKIVLASDDQCLKEYQLLLGKAIQGELIPRAPYKKTTFRGFTSFTDKLRKATAKESKDNDE
ncbi:hypothetical protein FC83_GL002933 [Agrilactobacillus composti DSM 18527 = JCM 14202]|uniref:Uncharacterized protein n=1 Tax=Agrilactobacillus composti DSM 18527 = JCM 14202 TaxID=1423734 RepID=X0QTX0_9LACO|nr:hypothetical protein [Agrilactobacillus composti]KRM33365.1 hypothetical protein FC83_GL002933 [Agrilactobacillus composti DSM 18527 = JCM 14202]GAF42035.1 hypothetical protein JCM14202_4033 [Agrilactobacillus composti DSM 18527 = JCM 14202]